MYKRTGIVLVKKGLLPIDKLGSCLGHFFVRAVFRLKDTKYISTYLLRIPHLIEVPDH